jgi:hypothetical protein
MLFKEAEIFCSTFVYRVENAELSCGFLFMVLGKCYKHPVKRWKALVLGLI